MTARVAWALAPLAGFYTAAARVLPVVETVLDAEVPAPLRALLAPPSPLTPRLEDHHGDVLALRVLERRRDNEFYARLVVLERGDGIPVALGAIELDLTRLSPAIRAAVLAEEVPFGHLLATATADPDALLRVGCDPFIAEALALASPGAWLYGRRRTLSDDAGATIARIVEILAPVLPRCERVGRTGS